MLKRFIRYYKPYRLMFTLDMLACVLIAACDMFYPMITKNIINEYVPQRQIKLMLIWCGALLLVYLIKYALSYFVSYYGHIVGLKMQADMRRDLFEHLQKLPFSFFDKSKTGSLMSRMVSDLNEISELCHHGPEDLFLTVLMFIGSFFVLLPISWELTVIVFAFVPLILFFASMLRVRMKNASRRSREQIAELNANIETAISGVRVSRAYTAENHELEKFDKENRLFADIRGRFLKVFAIFHSTMTFFSDSLYVVVLVAGGSFFYFGKIDVGEFTAYLLYISLFLAPIRKFVNMFEQMQDGMTGIKRFMDILDIPAEPQPDKPVSLDNVKGEIEFKNVSFSYGNHNSKQVIENLSLKIPYGKTVALVGPSGGGKTTLCNIIPRFYEISSGEVTIDGVDIKDVTTYDLRQNIGIVSQDVFLFNGTVRENIAYGKLDATDEEIAEAAKKANIYDFIMGLENGFDTNVGERGVTLSGGQKQRISIARVFLKNPAILILDEATSALDNATEVAIQSSLEELSRGRTVLVVAHRLSTIKNADEIVVITHRGIEEQGSHEELIKRNGIYKGLYEYQFR